MLHKKIHMRSACIDQERQHNNNWITRLSQPITICHNDNHKRMDGWVVVLIPKTIFGIFTAIIISCFHPDCFVVTGGQLSKADTAVPDLRRHHMPHLPHHLPACLTLPHLPATTCHMHTHIWRKGNPHPSSSTHTHTHTTENRELGRQAVLLQARKAGASRRRPKKQIGNDDNDLSKHLQLYYRAPDVMPLIGLC